jgi:polysaccharide export outer membrane protein
MTTKRAAAWAIALTVTLAATATAQAQRFTDWDPKRVLATREALQDLLTRLEQVQQSSAYSGRLKVDARMQSALIRQRLAEGDFQVGDRLLVQVEGEPQLTDTFTVTAGRVITVPVVGQFPLSGVLRAELESSLKTFLAKFLREPVVHARSLMPLSLLGEVTRPGFYTVPTEVPLTATLMQAGGPTRDAKLTEIKVERDGRTIWEGDALQRAITEGRTLDQLNLRAGDQVIVPKVRQSNWEGTARTVSLLLSIPLAVWGVTRLFH